MYLYKCKTFINTSFVDLLMIGLVLSLVKITGLFCNEDGNGMTIKK